MTTAVGTRVAIIGSGFSGSLLAVQLLRCFLPGGRVYLMISSDSDLDLYGKAIAKAGFKARLAFEHSIMFESFPLYELTLRSLALSSGDVS